MILSYQSICKWGNEGGISPFVPERVQAGSIDLALSRFFTRTGNEEAYFETAEYRLNPHSSILALSEEYVSLPPTMRGIIHMRSKYARNGLDHRNAGLIDAGFEGRIVFEFFTVDLPYLLVAGVAYVQMELAWLDEPTAKPYNGNFQGQRSIKVW